MIQNNRNRIIGLVLATVLVAVIGFFVLPRSGRAPQPQVMSRPAPSGLSHEVAGYATSDSCRECHPRYYSTWHDTYHRTMTQLATPETVVAPFDDVTLSSRGQTHHLQRQGDTFIASIIANGKLLGSPHAIVMTTGSHLMQTYWIHLGGELRHLPWFYHIEEKMWIPSQDTFLTPPSDGHVSGRWNDTCIKCHSTGPVPGYDSSLKFDTRVAELGIACEACHGPAAQHVEFHRTKNSDPSAAAAAALVNPAKLSHVAGSQICGQCHSSSQARDRFDWLKNGSHYRPGQDHHLEFRHAKLGSAEPADAPYLEHSFWNDGACRVGGDEFLGLQDSACFQQGQMSCFSCHSMHDSDPTDQLRKVADSNESCLQCHESFRDQIEQHTHHPTGSSGSQCYNCHMPHTSYALFKAIRSHRVDIPKTTDSTRGARPNACNLCHLDQTLQWTATHLTDWYGTAHVTMDETDQTTAASLLWLLRGDAMQRVISAWAMSWPPAREASGSDWQAPFLAEILVDSYPAIRFVGWRALRKLPGFQGLDYDFLASPDERSGIRQQAIQQWTSLQAVVDAARAARVLLTPAGPVDSESARRIQSQRDDRPIDILE